MIGSYISSQPEAGNFNGVTPEFGRTPDVEKIFGIKKGTLYNLHQGGKIHGVSLRLTGHIKGVRLWNMASIRAYIHSQRD